MPSVRFNTVEEYLVSLGPEKGETLRSVLDYILAQFPELECKISWNVPQVHRDGKYVFGVSAARKHLTLAPWSTAVLEEFRERLAPLEVHKNCFNVPVDWKLDKKLIRDMVRRRLDELD